MSNDHPASPAGTTTAKLTLYGPPEAPFTEKVRRALALKGLEFSFREPAGPEDYKRWSPDNGLLPVLTVDDERIQDSTAILRRLDELYPDPPLLATDPRLAMQQRQLEEWADESFLWYYLKWLRMQEAESASDTERRTGPLARFRSLRMIGAWLRAGGTWERPVTALQRGLADRLDDLVNFLGSRPFFYSDRVSMGDLAVYAMLYSMSLEAIPGAPRLLATRQTLGDFMRRVEDATGGARSDPQPISTALQ